MPVPAAPLLDVLCTTTCVLNVIDSTPLGGTQDRRALAREANRVLRLVVVELISEVEGSCRGGRGTNVRTVLGMR